MTRLRVKAHAKINLNLRILGRAPDGYHCLESVVQEISLHDILEIETRANGLDLEVDDPAIPADERNLVWRAARRMADLAPVSTGLKIRLRKNIPAGAGLGGGSSDAAATLGALNELWRVHLPAVDLAAAAAALGSDVPYFLVGGAALLSGRGTEVHPLPEPLDYLLLLIFPGMPLSTREVYAQVQAPLTPTGKMASMSRFVSATDGGVEAWVRQGNDLAPVARRLCPAIEAIEAGLARAGATAAGVTGSGSAVFGVFRDREARDRAADALAEPGWAVWRCSPIGRAERSSAVRPD